MRIIIVTNHELVKAGLHRMLLQAFKEANIIEKNSLAELEATPLNDIDVAIVGSSVIDEADDGVAKIVAVKNKWESSGFILLEELRDKRCLDTLLSLQSVMQGFITLETDYDTLTSCVSSVYEGKKYIAQELAQLLLENFQTQKPTQPPPGRINLTKREFEIATMLISGVKVSDVAKRTGRKISTISTIKKNILRKTNVENLFSLRDVLQN